MNSKTFKTLFFLAVFLTVLNQSVYAQEMFANIKVHIHGIKTTKGLLKGFLFNSESSFLKNTYKEVKIRPQESNQNIVVFERVPYGYYAINVHHDVNQNDKLDTNLFRVPKEPYGFSNNVRGKMGPPSFDEVKLLVNSQQIELSITTK